jgi:hypothetical protein
MSCFSGFVKMILWYCQIGEAEGAKYEILPVIPCIKLQINESSLPTENQTNQTPQN